MKNLFFVVIILGLVILMGIATVNSKVLIKDGVFPARYVVSCIKEGTDIATSGHVRVTNGPNKIIEGYDGLFLKVTSFNENSSVGDDIFLYGTYKDGTFNAEKIIKRGVIMKNRYVSSVIILPIFLFFFFREYKIKGFKFTKR